MTILLKNTTQGTNTDANGEFALPLAGAEATGAVLVISYIGYLRTELPTITAVGAVPAAIRLRADTQILMGEVVVTNYKRPWPWHPRRLFGWGKYWLAKPFRHE